MVQSLRSKTDALDQRLASRCAIAHTENETFEHAKRNEAFVMMEYFGYLRRDPDEGGYQYWLNNINQFNGNFEQAEMVKAFINSAEYRQRFGR